MRYIGSVATPVPVGGWESPKCHVGASVLREFVTALSGKAGAAMDAHLAPAADSLW